MNQTLANTYLDSSLLSQRKHGYFSRYFMGEKSFFDTRKCNNLCTTNLITCKSIYNKAAFYLSSAVTKLVSGGNSGCSMFFQGEVYIKWGLPCHKGSAEVASSERDNSLF